VISNSVLGHLNNPHQSLRDIKSKMKFNGYIIFSVPHETINWKYKANEINNLLFTWSPMSLGNLFNDLGFEVIKVKCYKEITFPFELKTNNQFVFKTLNLLRPVYRLFRLILDELRIFRIGTDGNIIIYAKKTQH
jgi:hypothetical protein